MCSVTVVCCMQRFNYISVSCDKDAGTAGILLISAVCSRLVCSLTVCSKWLWLLYMCDLALLHCILMTEMLLSRIKRSTVSVLIVASYRASVTWLMVFFCALKMLFCWQEANLARTILSCKPWYLVYTLQVALSSSPNLLVLIELFGRR